MDWTSLPVNGELSNITGVATYVNTISNGWFWPIIILCVFFISFIVMVRYGSVKSALASSFISFVLSIFLFFAGLISELFFFGVFGVFILCFIGSFFFD